MFSSNNIGKYLLVTSVLTCISSVAPTGAFAVTFASQSEPQTITLYGAGSLRGALSEVANSFSQEYKNPVITEFGPSGTLRERIEKGEKPDVFASADIGNPQKLYEQGLSSPVVNFTSNRMTAVVRPGFLILSIGFLLVEEQEQ
ncbi:hypothetical protein F7734_14075 [Scytonema sp. UIC 10036]|uniref:substrate-binding domain-containing protein n=1 Tax=Scytonema sp. UIC 10036 TaxID=2304196 RepID=UPI0012DACFE9|nr:substrate-binding domain-containing protein [Scytonema sp. UIC 10036]MUG93494.1 hypothetical protein [Scytonema sp. UIC 10036]